MPVQEPPVSETPPSSPVAETALSKDEESRLGLSLEALPSNSKSSSPVLPPHPDDSAIDRAVAAAHVPESAATPGISYRHIRSPHFRAVSGSRLPGIDGSEHEEGT